MCIKKQIIAAALVALPLIAGCQQRTSFDACVEYYEQNIRDPSAHDLMKKLSKIRIWDECAGI